MKKVVIKEINNYDYLLIDNNHEYLLNIEFYSKYQPQKNDIIYIPDNILYEKNLYAFDEIYDTQNIDIDDIIKIVHGNDEYYFQRKYG